jgi:hypothetical protein
VHREVDGHDLVVFYHLNISSVLFEKLIGVLLRKLKDPLFHIRKCNGKLINQAEDVEPLSDASLERVFNEQALDLFQICIFRQSELFLYELGKDGCHPIDKDDKVVQRVCYLSVDFYVDGTLHDTQK